MKVLRISSYPTLERPGMGLHPYKVTEMMVGRAETCYVSQYNSEVKFDVPVGVEFEELSFFSGKRDANTNFINRVIFSFRRSLSVLNFSAKIIFSRKVKSVDIVHIHSPMFIIVALYFMMFGKKSYITYHGSDFNAIRNSKLYKCFLGKLTGAFAISPSMIDGLKNIHGKDKVYQTHNAIDLNDYHEINGLKRSESIIAVGSLKSEKAFDILISAFSKVIEDSIFKDYQLLIVGEGPLRKQLEDQIVKLGLSSKVFLLGHKTKTELLELYSTNELFVLSSISEGFPKVILESLACNLKIVTTNVGVVPKIFKNYPYVVAPYSSNALGNAIKGALLDEKDYELGDILNKFSSWEKVASKYLEVYTNDSL